MSPGYLAVGFVIALVCYCAVFGALEIFLWVHSRTQSRPHRDEINWQRTGLTDSELNYQWRFREAFMSERQARLDETQRAIVRLK